ncbi:T9SS type A sorting domain-containing protein [uncultured Psychroserpens sp.]|uniref:T9SS type A sorting domain-containing protein n=1 Tax=uncultured Psychroserpens sp. TaxID=255436 RepID=UPI00261C0097|nr:T9SS type A sorting domain-containing protein [uncultured Psychroserpens sp.]
MKKITKASLLLFCLLISTTGLFANTTPESNDNDPQGEDLRMKIRLEYNSPNSFMREILVMADENATEGYDADFDSEMNNIQADDMYWVIDSGKYLNQGITEINEETVLSLGINTSTNGLNTIAIDKLENIPSSMKIFLHDTTLDEYHSLKEGPYEVNLNSGVYLNRFKIVFMQPETLGTNEFETAANALDIRFNVAADQIKISNKTNLKIEAVEVYSILGKSVHRSNTPNTNSELNIDTNRLTTGTYVVIVRTNNGINSKKILVN